MFGMPAVKLPAQPAAPVPAPAPTPAPVAAPAPDPAPAAPVQEDAFKATMLGMPAVDVDAARATSPSPAATAPQEAFSPPAEAASAALEAAPVDAGMPDVAPAFSRAEAAARDLGDDIGDAPAPKKKGKLMLWLIIGGAVLLTLIAIVLAVYFLVIRPASQAAAEFDQLMMPGLQQQLQQLPTAPVPGMPQPGAIPQIPLPVPPQAVPPAPAPPAPPAAQ
jgi:hypothetical protein